MMGKNNLFVIGIVFSFVIFSTLLIIPLVSAAPGAPTGLMINQNVTAVYDEGTFFVNWTKGGDDTTANYTIYIAADGNHFLTAPNNSATGYSFSNTTQANYTFTIEAVNATVPSKVNSTTNISIFVDTTVPTALIHTSYTNATAKKNTATLTLNISVSDANSGLTGSSCTVDVNGTNQTLALFSGWCNSTSVYLTSKADGNEIIRIWINDTVSNAGNNYTRYVLIDTTNPSATPTCSPTSVVRGNTLTCSCSASDATSGVSTSTASDTITTTATGSFTYTCTVTDAAGNSVSSDATYTVTSGSDGAPPSSTSGGATSTKLHGFAEIVPGKVSIMKNFDEETGIKEIQIQVNNPAQNVKITVLKYDGKPAEVSVEKSGKVFQYIQIKTENLEDNLEKATITTKVKKTWVSDNGLEEENIALFKFNEATINWEELTTTYEEEDNIYYYYVSELTSFSYFAISEKVIVAEPEGDKSIKGAIKDSEDLKKSGNLKWIWIIAIVLVALITLGVINRRKK